MVFFATGEWYVSAFCHRVGGERMFRVDRIRAVRPTGVTFEPAEDASEPARVFNPRQNDPTVTLRLRPSAAWVPESFPTEAVRERPDGSLDVDGSLARVPELVGAGATDIRVKSARQDLDGTSLDDLVAGFRAVTSGAM